MRIQKRFKIILLALGFLLLHKAQALGASSAQASTALPAMRVEGEAAPASEDASDTGPGASSAAEAAAPQSSARVVFVGIAPGGIELAPQAGVLTTSLEAFLRKRNPLVTLEALPAVRGVSAAQYWNNCPELEGCLQVLATRVQADFALMGFFRPGGPRPEPIAGVEPPEGWTVSLQLIDLVTVETLPPLEIQGTGDDYSLVEESLGRLLTRREALHLKPKAVVTPAPQKPLPRLTLAPEVPPTPPPASWSLEGGHRGQLLFRLSAGGAYGQLGQDYVSYHLTDDDQVIESFSRLTATSSAGGNVQLGVGYGLTPRLELEVQGGLLAGAGRLRYQETPAVTYQAVQPDIFGSCQSDVDNVCPVDEESVSATWALALRGRYMLSLQERMQPFLVGGLSFMVMSDLVRQYQALDYLNLSWLDLFQPIQALGVTLGPGFQLELSPNAGFFIQVPVTWRFWTNQDQSYASYSPAEGGAYLSDLPGTLNNPPVTAAVDIGFQLRAF